MEDISDSAISVLPPEILSRIFSVLPLADRKSVRLVSRAWHDSSICVDVTKREKFVFRNGFCIQNVKEVLLRSNYPVMNLEFQILPVRYLPEYLWRGCGQRIRTLKFHHCQLHYKLMSHIILHCENLTSLTITSLGIAKLIQLWMLRPLDDLIKKGIQRPKLHTMRMKCGVQLPESVLRRIFILCPSIKHFTITAHRFACTFTCCLTSHFIESSAFWRLYKCTEEIPEDNNQTNVTWMETLINIAEQGLKLKQLLWTFAYARSMKYTVLDFFKSQRNLEVINIKLIDTEQSNNDERKIIFFHILDNCPNLKEYHFKTYQKVLFKPSELPRFIAAISRLKFLSLTFNVVDSEPIPTHHNLLSNLVHLNLTSLKWDVFGLMDFDFSFCAAFLQRCSSLQHLHLAGCNDTTLQTIFQYLIELRTLVVLDVASCTDFGFTGRDCKGEQKGYSIKRLQQLKYLELRRPINFDEDIVDDIRKSLAQVALELQAPHLEFLSLDRGFYIELSEEESSYLASQLPQLRVLTIEPFHDNYYQEKTVEFCKQFKNLHHLIGCRESDLVEREADEINDIFDIAITLDERLVKSLFSACPTLRFITDIFGTTSFCNPFTGRVLHETLCSSDCTASIFEYKSEALT